MGHLISQHELATRLSYFLWASVPDAELRRAASNGTLRQPAVLEAQVRRMLKDPRSRVLAEEFGGQWLQFRALESLTRDKDKFPDFEDYLRLSMRRETELFIEHIIREDRPVLDFLDAPYTFVNERLARHYGIPNVDRPRVPPRRSHEHEARRRADAGERADRLVLRDAHVAGAARQVDSRQHPRHAAAGPAGRHPESGRGKDRRRHDRCASRWRRTARIRPARRATGAWIRSASASRTSTRSAPGAPMDGKFPIDATGRLPDGREFEGPVELREILKGDREAFTRTIASKLMTYALGRGLERYDRHAVKTIAAKVAANDYRFSSLVMEIVQSRPFQMRRGKIEPERAAPGPATRQRNRVPGSRE